MRHCKEFCSRGYSLIPKDHRLNIPFFGSMLSSQLTNQFCRINVFQTCTCMSAQRQAISPPKNVVVISHSKLLYFPDASVSDCGCLFVNQIYIVAYLRNVILGGTQKTNKQLKTFLSSH